MRVISGIKRGTKLYSPSSYNVRPTSDKVKESLFNILNEIDDKSVVLDLFSGSGAIGIEFLSRGANKVFFCDNSSESINTIKLNLNKTGLTENATIIEFDFYNSIEYFYKNKIKFDYIFLDPPYKENYIEISLDLIKKYGLLSLDGIIILETDRDIDITDFEIIKEKKYSKTKIIFLQENY